MLYTDRSASALSRWAHAGWQPMLGPSPAHQQIYYALLELEAAGDAGDAPVVRDLATELQMLLPILLSDPHPLAAGSDSGDVRAAVVEIWGQLERSRGALAWDELALHARTLRKLAGPDRITGDRPAAAAAPYIPPHRRLGAGAHLPLVEATADLTDEWAAATFLLGLAEALAGGQTHLRDYRTGDQPNSRIPARVGWPPGAERPTVEQAVGAVRDDLHAGGTIVLRPGVAIEVVNRLLRPTRTALDADQVARALTDAWVLDTTLTMADSGVIERRLAVQAPIIVGHRLEWLWQIPETVWHPYQFRTDVDGGAGLNLRLVPSGG